MAKRKTKKIKEDFSDYNTQITANSYILVNPKFPIDTVFNLLSVHNKVKATMILQGTEKDFEDNPNTVYKVVKEKKTLQLAKKGDQYKNV